MTDKMKECDLILKGGLSSGVVYPQAISEIAKQFRFRSIGGTSAGAIAAIFAAAAEYRRQASEAEEGVPQSNANAGFVEIEKVGQELAQKMELMLQPDRQLVPLYKILLSFVESGNGKAASFWAVLKSLVAFKFPASFSVLLLLFTAWIWHTENSVSALIAGILATVIFFCIAYATQLFRAVTIHLPKSDFGICSGRTQSGQKVDALTDWMVKTLDSISGKAGDDTEKILTIGDLGDYGIEIASITTDISSGRPYQLPLKSKNHYFSKAEFSRILPENIVEYLVDKGKKYSVEDLSIPDDLFQLPTKNDFPVILVARMSLSFPGLISAVPLYRIDNSLTQSTGSRMVRCHFIDGGVSSNFPIHFFDNLLPSRPTFGIAFGSYSEKRKRDSSGNRIVYSNAPPNAGVLPAVTELKSVFTFFGAIINTSKDWQDALQARLPGYSERIVHVLLDGETEGGLNLRMDTKLIEKLGGYGREAGQTLVKEFDFDEHRYRRALSVLPKLEEALEGVSNAANSGNSDFLSILERYESTSFRGNTEDWRKNTLRPFVEKLMALGAEEIRAGRDLPRADAQIRLVADADRIPADE